MISKFFRSFKFGIKLVKLTKTTTILVEYIKAILKLVDHIRLIRFAVVTKWDLNSLKHVFNLAQSLQCFGKESVNIYVILDKICLKYLKISYGQILWIYDKYTKLRNLYKKIIEIEPLTTYNLKNYTDYIMSNTNSFIFHIKKIIFFKGVYLDIILLNIAIYMIILNIDIELINQIFIPLIYIITGYMFLHIFIYMWEIKIHPLYKQKDYDKLIPYLTLSIIVLSLGIIFIIYGIYLYIILIKGKYYTRSSNSSDSDSSLSELGNTPKNPFSSKNNPKSPKDPKDPNVYYAENPSRTKEKEDTEKDSGKYRKILPKGTVEVEENRIQEEKRKAEEREREARRQWEEAEEREREARKQWEEADTYAYNLEWAEQIIESEEKRDKENADIQQQRKEKEEALQAEQQARKTEQQAKEAEEVRKKLEENSFFNWGNTGERRTVDQEQIRQQQIRQEQIRQQQINEEQRKQAENIDLDSGYQKWLAKEAEEKAEKALKKAEESALKAKERKRRRVEKALLEKNRKFAEEMKKVDAFFDEAAEDDNRRFAEEMKQFDPFFDHVENTFRRVDEIKHRKATEEYNKAMEEYKKAEEERRAREEEEKRQQDIINGLKIWQKEEATKKRKSDENDFFDWGDTGKRR